MELTPYVKSHIRKQGFRLLADSEKALQHDSPIRFEHFSSEMRSYDNIGNSVFFFFFQDRHRHIHISGAIIHSRDNMTVHIK